MRSVLVMLAGVLEKVGKVDIVDAVLVFFKADGAQKSVVDLT